MTPTELEEKIKRILCGACPSEGDNKNGYCVNCTVAPVDLVLDKLDDSQLHALLAWEFWKDGADWNDMVADIATGQYLPFNTRAATIDQLRKVFGYQ
ncbi:MAG: hypothetical protein IMZ61_16395 [Planctomycetes bacterium]|nr:hypothetical protein [Chloroflexota bacterium]MBE3145482.1 hypothetical protein [Planctomycetota bacterium]